MTDFGGDFSVPISVASTVLFTVVGWTEAAVTVNKLPIPGVVSIQVDRNLNVGAGQCTLTVSDPGRIYYDMFQPQDEIEVYFSKTVAGTSFGRKIWGGYIDHFDTSLDSGLMTIAGKEYISRLASQTFNGALSGTYVSAINTLMTNQNDFTYEGVSGTLVDNVSVSVTNDTMYNALKQMSDQVSVYFWIDPATRDLNARKAVTIPQSPDQILEGVNLLRKSSVNKNSEYMTNKVIINYNGGSTTAITDPTSISNRGTFSRTQTVGNINTSPEAGTFGTALVSNRSAPTDAFGLECLYLPYTDPGDYILITAPSLGISGAYQVTKITHKWSKQAGITSAVEVGAQYIDRDTYIADLQRRLSITERKTFTGV